MVKAIRKGMFVQPKKKRNGVCGHEDFKGRESEIFRIDKMQACTHSDGSCKDCAGNPIIILNGVEIHFCGWGTPLTNFKIVNTPNIRKEKVGLTIY